MGTDGKRKLDLKTILPSLRLVKVAAIIEIRILFHSFSLVRYRFTYNDLYCVHKADISLICELMLRAYPTVPIMIAKQSAPMPPLPGCFSALTFWKHLANRLSFSALRPYIKLA
jgi:hypothetical protein